MRLIHPSIARGFRDHALAVALAMLVVGGSAVVLMAILPPTRVAPIALLGLSAALALGVGAGMAWRAVASARRRRERISDDLGRLLAPTLDDSYTLVLAPRLPGVPDDLAGLLVGPAGVKAFIARRWRGRYRVRGRGWEYDTRSRAGWIPTVTNPSFDADAVAAAVSRWTRDALGDQTFAIAGAVAFPRSYSTVVLEEPVGEVVTADNAPWWAQSIGRVQRLDPVRAARFVDEVLNASEEEARGTARAASPNPA
ncbi:MAG: hypothetical protein ACXWWU_02065 [Candidatus Limnocylindria bacterium]